MRRLTQLFVLSFGLSTTAMADGRSTMLRSLLAVTPVSFLGPLDARWDVMFSDLPAAALAISARPADCNAIFGTRFGPMARAGLPPLTDTMDPDSLTQWPALVGFDVEQVQAILTVQAPPESVLVLRLSAGVAPSVGPALLANGYARADQIYVRGQEDLSINLADRNPADLFGTGPFVTVLTATVPTTASNGMIRNRPWSILMQAYDQRALTLLAPMLP